MSRKLSDNSSEKDHLISHKSPMNNNTFPSPDNNNHRKKPSFVSVISSQHPYQSRNNINDMKIINNNNNNNNNKNANNDIKLRGRPRRGSSISMLFDRNHTDGVSSKCCKFECQRCITHCWYIMWCCFYLFYSSLPRVTTVVDVVITGLLYLIHVRESEGGEGVWHFIENEFTHYNFRESALSVVFLSLLRSITLFFVYAYRYQTNPWSLLIASCVTLFSLIYVIIKLALLTNHNIAGLLWYSLIMIIGEHILFLLVRRKRITGTGLPDRMDSYKKVEEDPYNNEHIRPSKRASSPAPMVYSSYVEPEEFADNNSEFLEIDNIKIHYKTNGCESDLGVILLHGFGGSTYSWNRAWDLLTGSNWRLVAFDRPGFGLSSRPSGTIWSYEANPYSPEYQLILINKLIESLNIKQVVFVGHDSGASLAIHYTARYPDIVKGLFLIAPTIYTEGMPQLVRSLFRTSLGKEIVHQLVRTELGQVALRRAWYKPSHIPDDVLENYRNLHRIQGWEDSVMEMSKLPPLNVQNEVSCITCSVLVLHGIEDKLVDIAESKQLVMQFERCEDRSLLSLQECGHVPHEEHPHLFSQYLCQFIQKFQS